MSTLTIARNREWEQILHDGGMVAPNSQAYVGRLDEERLQAIVSHEQWAPGDKRWHLSIAGAEDVPSWRAITEVTHHIRPGVPFVMGVPPRSWWMNVHPHVLHLWETKDEQLITQWRINAEGHTPD